MIKGSCDLKVGAHQVKKLSLIKFGGLRYCSSRDNIYLVCHMIKEDHVIKGSDDYNNRRLWRYVITVSSLVVIGTVVVEI